MLNRSNVRLGITGALLLLILGALSACSDGSMTGVDDGTDNSANCIKIQKVVYCYSDN